MTTAEIVSVNRIRWGLLDASTIRAVRDEAAAHGDTRLVRLANRALDARCWRRQGGQNHRATDRQARR